MSAKAQAEVIIHSERSLTMGIFDKLKSTANQAINTAANSAASAIG